MEPTKVNKPRIRQREIRTVYSLSQITKKIALPITAIGRSLQQTIEETIYEYGLLFTKTNRR
jgi:hypothetical protein